MYRTLPEAEPVAPEAPVARTDAARPSTTMNNLRVIGGTPEGGFFGVSRLIRMPDLAARSLHHVHVVGRRIWPHPATQCGACGAIVRLYARSEEEADRLIRQLRG